MYARVGDFYYTDFGSAVYPRNNTQMLFTATENLTVTKDYINLRTFPPAFVPLFIENTNVSWDFFASCRYKLK